MTNSNLAKYHNVILGLGSAWVAGYGAGIALGVDEPGQIAGAGLAIGGTFLYLSNIKWPKTRYSKTLSHSIRTPFFKPKPINIEMSPTVFNPVGNDYFNEPCFGNGYRTPIPHLIFRKRLKYAELNRAHGVGMSDKFTNDAWWPEGLASDYHQTFMGLLSEVQNNLKVNGSPVVLFTRYDNNWAKLIKPANLVYDYCYQYECLNGF